MANRYAKPFYQAAYNCFFMFPPKTACAIFFLKPLLRYTFPKTVFRLVYPSPLRGFSKHKGLDARGEAVRTPNGFPYIPARLRQMRLPMMAAAPVTATSASTAAANTPRSAVDGVDVSDDAALDSSAPARLPNARISET